MNALEARQRQKASNKTYISIQEEIENTVCQGKGECNFSVTASKSEVECAVTMLRSEDFNVSYEQDTFDPELWQFKINW